MRQYQTVTLKGNNILERFEMLRRKVPEYKLGTMSAIVQDIFDRYCEEVIAHSSASQIPTPVQNCQTSETKTIYLENADPVDIIDYGIVNDDKSRVLQLFIKCANGLVMFADYKGDSGKLILRRKKINPILTQ